MKAWELMYRKEVLDEGKTLVDDVKIISSDGVEIIGEIEGFEVKTYIEYNSPSYASCSCPQMAPCKHEAAFIYYLEKHQDMCVCEFNLKNLLDSIDSAGLKKFLLEEFERNDDLKNRFINEFTSQIDKNYYKNKLSGIFKKGKGRDFEYHGFYELKLMASDLNDFMMNDIYYILLVGEYDFACNLLCKIGDLLDDEMMSCQDSWYDLSDSFMQYVHILSNSIHLDSEKMKELNSKTGLITDIITVF